MKFRIILSVFPIAVVLFFCVSSFAQVSFSDQKIIACAEIDQAYSVYAIDLDGDGDIDVLSASVGDDKIAWYENVDGHGTFGNQQIISTAADEARSVYAIDLDGDGDVDVLSASSGDHKIAWYENMAGYGNFGPQRIICTTASVALSVYATDIDGDKDIDVLSASFGDRKIAWYENLDGMGTFGRQRIIATLGSGPECVYASDLDGDGDMDVLFPIRTFDGIAWCENTDGQGTFGAQKVITNLAKGGRCVFAADLDEDGDMDVLSASMSDNKIAWYENMDGKGTFGQQRVITIKAITAISVYTSDLDADGDMDVLSASFNDNKIAWYENIDGQDTFSDQKVIASSAIGAICVYAEDLDGDGDSDVLSASRYDNKIAWYENLIPHVEIPVFDPVAESYISSAEITISCSASDAVIYYTTNGVDPEQSDSLYSGPIVIDTCTVFKAKAFKTGMFPSPIAECMYAIVVDTPAFSPTPPDTFDQSLDISIFCSTPEAVIHYTINGEEPTELDSVYTNPISVDTTTTVKAKAFKHGCEPSAVAEAMYVIDLSSPVVESLSENRISEFKLFENYPNPFNLSTRLQYQLPKESVVFLKLFDLLGRTVVTFENGIIKETGSHSVLWDGRDANGSIVPSGVYILRIQAGDYIEQKKLVLTK